jgi:phage tail-like protein
MDANQTRFHLLLGEADWSRCTELQPDPFRTEWDKARYEVRLADKLFRFVASKFDLPPRIERRRGAARDRYGNRYWISESEQEIRVSSAGADTAAHFWQSGDGIRCERRGTGDFAAAETERPSPPVTLRGLVVAEDHYLIVGVPEPKGLLIFDLHSGGPPQQFFWPKGLPFSPFDMAARPGGGAWILDREAKRYWGLNRHFQIMSLSSTPLASPPKAEPPHYFTASEESAPSRPQCVVEEPLSLEASASLIAINPVAIEAAPDGTVLILDSPPDAPFSTVWHYDCATLLGSATTENIRELVEPDPKVDVTMLGHDFAFVPAHQEEGEAVLDRLYVTAADGNQTFAFEFVRGSSAGLELQPLEVYLPMRLFSGKALVAAGTQLYYDFGERWIPLLPQKRRRYVTEATLLTPAFDGDEPDCVWHRLMLDGCLPPESGVEIWSRTANDKKDLQRAPWQDEPPLYRRGDGSELPWFPKPKSPNAGTWELLFQRAEGRFLQLQVRLSGNGQSSPRLRALRLYYPRFSYLKNYLPALYRDDRDSASFLDRFLANPEGLYTATEDKIAATQMLFDLRTAPAETLEWLANWFDVALDPAWDEPRRRLFIRHAMEFFQWRGTARGMVMALRLAFEENPGPALFSEVGARSPCARRFRIVERFRTRRTPGVLLGDPSTDVGGPIAVESGQRWRPRHGAEALHERYRKFLGNGVTRFALAPPPEQEDRRLWQQFARQALGFVPSAAFVADGGRQLRWWQEFLARRHAGISSLNAAYGTNWPEFAAVPIPAELPTNEIALRDWLQFEGVALPMHRAAHAFSVLLPATRREATDSDLRLRTLQWANRLIKLEKPAHTVFDVKFYWAFFRVGEARLGEDTQLGQGCRAPELLPPLILGQGFLAESYIAPGHPQNVRERTILGRDAIFHHRKN